MASWLTSMLDSGLSSQDLGALTRDCVVFLSKKLTSNSPSLLPDVYKSVLVNLMLGLTL